MPPHPFDLTGRLALVTGGGGGLGLAIARGLRAAGARVVLNGRNRPKLDAAALSLEIEGGASKVEVAPFDVADADAVAAGIAAIEHSFGAPDIVVNNAAVNRRAPLDEFTPDEWHRLLAANLDGPFY